MAEEDKQPGTTHYTYITPQQDTGGREGRSRPREIVAQQNYGSVQQQTEKHPTQVSEGIISS